MQRSKLLAEVFNQRLSSLYKVKRMVAERRDGISLVPHVHGAVRLRRLSPRIRRAFGADVAWLANPAMNDGGLRRQVVNER